MVENNKFRILSKKEVTDDSEINVIRLNGRRCAITDYAILQGAYASNDFSINDKQILKSRTGWWDLPALKNNIKSLSKKFLI